MLTKMTLGQQYYTFRFLLTGYIGLILRSTAVATANQSTLEGTIGYSAVSACTVVPVTVV